MLLGIAITQYMLFVPNIEIGIGITKWLKAAEVFEGETCTFECILSRESAEESSWSLDGQAITSGGRFKIATKGRKYTLTIKDVVPADAGEVVFTIKDLSSKTTLGVEGMCLCQETDQAIKCQYEKLPMLLSLRVGKASSLSRGLENVTAFLSEDAVFTCEVTQTGSTVNWAKEGKLIRKSQKYDINQEDKVMRLTVRNVAAQDSGEYSCEVVGGATTKAKLEIKGNESCCGFLIPRNLAYFASTIRVFSGHITMKYIAA